MACANAFLNSLFILRAGAIASIAATLNTAIVQIQTGAL